jgi:hypothetical protein
MNTKFEEYICGILISLLFMVNPGRKRGLFSATIDIWKPDNFDKRILGITPLDRY